MNTSSVIRRGAAGYILLELVIAVTIFAIAVVSLTRSLNTALEAGNVLNKDVTVRAGLRAFIEEVKRKSVSDMVLSVTDERLGITYSSEVAPLQMNVARSGQQIPDLYQMTAKAVYQAGNEQREESVVMWFYQPQVEQDRRRNR